DAQAVAITAAAVGRNQQAGRRRIQLASFVTPPTTDGGDRKSGSVVIGPHINEAGVLPQIIDAVGIGARHRRVWKIVVLDLFGGLLPATLAAFILDVAHQLLLLRVL